MVTSFSQFTPIEVKKILRNSQPQFGGKLGKLRLRRNCLGGEEVDESKHRINALQSISALLATIVCIYLFLYISMVYINIYLLKMNEYLYI